MNFRFQLLSAVVIGLLLSVQARADTVFTRADADQFGSLVTKLGAAEGDVLDSLKQTAYNDPAHGCLDGIRQETLVAVLHLTSAWKVLALATVMRDKRDELFALAMLKDALKPVAYQLRGSRQIINGWMGMCSQAATVNVKGQAVINIFSEIQQGIAPIQKTLDEVEKTLP